LILVSGILATHYYFVRQR